MRNKSFLKDFYALIPFIVGGLLCTILIYQLEGKIFDTPGFEQKLTELTFPFISIAGIISIMIVAYLITISATLKNNFNQVAEKLTTITQKMHDFRAIIEILLHSKMWLPGLKDYLEDEFAGLTFFDVKEFYKGKSKLAIEFLQENHNYADSENLYLELKSLLMTNPKDKKKEYNTIEYPETYNKEIIEKWMEHKCGSGLSYCFGYKYGAFKEAFDIQAVFERHQEKILALANGIDSDAFEDSSFNEVFLSKLGEYVNKQLVPVLFQLRGKANGGTPTTVIYLYTLFLLLVLFGILLPIFYLLFSLSSFLLVVSFSFVISCIFFIATTFYKFLIKDMHN